MNVLIAVLQMQTSPGEPAENLAAIARAARAAAAFGADLLVTPEMSLTGYAIGTADIARLAEPRSGAMIGAVRAIAEETGVAVVAGFPERDGGVVFNAAALVAPGSDPVIYRKGHLYGDAERAAFAPSTTPPAVFAFRGLKAGMLICYDVEFPEMVRSLALAGADLVIVPTALPAGAASRRVSKSVIPARALENHVFVVYAGLCGNERGTALEGGSAVVGPDGEDLARAGAAEALMFARIDTGGYDEARAENPYLADRRPGLYRLAD